MFVSYLRTNLTLVTGVAMPREALVYAALRQTHRDHALATNECDPGPSALSLLCGRSAVAYIWNQSLLTEIYSNHGGQSPLSVQRI